MNKNDMQIRIAELEAENERLKMMVKLGDIANALSEYSLSRAMDVIDLLQKRINRKS